MMNSSRFCQHPFESYDIRQSDLPLITAAINLGELLQVQPDFPRSSLAELKLLVEVLRNLPNPPSPDLCGDFGFELISIAEPNHGHHGAWGVSFCRSLFEIYSAKSAEDDPEEFSWLLCPGTENLNSLSNSSLWMAEIATPRALIRDGFRISFDAHVKKVGL